MTSRYQKAEDDDDAGLLRLIYAAHEMLEVSWEREHCDEGSPALNLYKALDKIGWIVEENGE
jgi:hypothetical protein